MTREAVIISKIHQSFLAFYWSHISDQVKWFGLGFDPYDLHYHCLDIVGSSNWVQVKFERVRRVHEGKDEKLLLKGQGTRRIHEIFSASYTCYLSLGRCSFSLSQETCFLFLVDLLWGRPFRTGSAVCELNLLLRRSIVNRSFGRDFSFLAKSAWNHGMNLLCNITLSVSQNSVKLIKAQRLIFSFVVLIARHLK